MPFCDPFITTNRTPDMPMDRQIRYAMGVQYKCSERLPTGAQFVYADYGKAKKAKIDNDLLKGDYKRNDLFFFDLNAIWKFWRNILFRLNLFLIFWLYSATQPIIQHS